jgi:RTX calcium-binding nonapeptide repeat (4 copies)/Beta-propeller repeat
VNSELIASPDYLLFFGESKMLPATHPLIRRWFSLGSNNPGHANAAVKKRAGGYSKRTQTNRGKRFGALRFELLESRRVLTGDFSFASAFIGGYSRGKAITTDAAGNVYTAGYFEGTVDFDPGTGSFNLTSAGLDDIFVSKQDNAGNFLWAKRIGGIEHDRANDIAVDGLGNVYTTGSFAGTVDFNPNAGISNLTSAGLTDVFVSKWDNSGNFVWSKRFGGANFDEPTGIAVDGLGNVHTVGDFHGTADFDPSAGIFNITSAGYADVFVSKLSGAGNFIWAKSFGGVDYDVVKGLSVDDSGNVVTTGRFVGTVDFDPGPRAYDVTSVNGGVDVFISKLDRIGNFIWAKSVGDVSVQEGEDIAIDKYGNLLVTGYYYQTVDFDPGAGVFNLSPTGTGADIFVLKLDMSGNFVWVSSFGGNSEERSGGVAVDQYANVYVAGEFSGIADFDPRGGTFNLTSAGNADSFVTKLDSSGNFVWAKSMGGDRNDTGSDIALDGMANVFSTGRFGDTADFDPGAGTYNLSGGGLDAYVSKLTQDFVVAAPTTTSANWSLRRNGSNIQVFDKNANAVIDQRPLNMLLGIQVNADPGFGMQLTLDYAFGGFFAYPNGIRFQGSSGNDTLSIASSTISPQDIIYRPTNLFVGASSFDVSGYSVQMQNVEGAVVTRARSLTYETQGSADSLTVSSVGLTGSRITGTSDTYPVQSLIWSLTPTVTIDTGANDGSFAGLANDTVVFGAGSLDATGMKNLTVNTGKGADTLTLQIVDLGLPVAGGSFRFNGGAGADRILATGNTDWRLNDIRLMSTAGGSLFHDEIERATLTGGAGNNVLNGADYSGALTLNGSGGNDVVRGGTGINTLLGGAGHDYLYGNLGNDSLDGGDGNDRLFGYEGNDTLNGGIGNDLLYGHDGDDTLNGGDNNDKLYGADGDDILNGNDGDDHLYGGLGNDAIDGGNGVDLLVFEGTNSSDTLRLQHLSATTANFIRRPRGLVSVLEQDSIVYDASDEVMINALDGDDQITVDAAFAILGLVDGGLGTDVCTAPAAWTKVSC